MRRARWWRQLNSQSAAIILAVSRWVKRLRPRPSAPRPIVRPKVKRRWCQANLGWRGDYEIIPASVRHPCRAPLRPALRQQCATHAIPETPRPLAQTNRRAQGRARARRPRPAHRSIKSITTAHAWAGVCRSACAVHLFRSARQHRRRRHGVRWNSRARSHTAHR